MPVGTLVNMSLGGNHKTLFQENEAKEQAQKIPVGTQVNMRLGGTIRPYSKNMRQKNKLYFVMYFRGTVKNPDASWPATKNTAWNTKEKKC